MLGGGEAPGSPKGALDRRPRPGASQPVYPTAPDASGEAPLPCYIAVALFRLSAYVSRIDMAGDKRRFGLNQS